MGKSKILIVDDDPDITEAIRIILENQGYEVGNATNGTKGLEQIKKFKPNLLILDVMMDQPDEGFSISRRLKKDPKYKNIPILMLTGIQEKSGFDFKTAAGDENWLPVDDFLDKPVKPEVLLEKVRSLLGS